VIHLVRLALPCNAVDAFLDNECCFDPSLCRQRPPQSLRALRLPAAASDDFLDRDCGLGYRVLKFSDGRREVGAKDGLGMREELNLKTPVDQRMNMSAGYPGDACLGQACLFGRD
jgi:hypothetical protein